MARVWEHSKQEGSGLLVILAIADQCDDDGVCWPSVRTIAKKARMAERTVQEILRRLDAEGEIRVQLRAGVVKTAGGIQRTNRYTVLVGRKQGGAIPAPPQQQGGADQPQGGAENGQGGAEATAPNPSLEPSGKPKEEGGEQTAPPTDKDNSAAREDMTPDEARSSIRRLFGGSTQAVHSMPAVTEAEKLHERRLLDPSLRPR